MLSLFIVQFIKVIADFAVVSFLSQIPTCILLKLQKRGSNYLLPSTTPKQFPMQLVDVEIPVTTHLLADEYSDLQKYTGSKVD